MAGRIAGITIEVAGDTTKLQSSLKGVDKSIRQTQSALKDVNKLLKLNPGNTELLVQKQRNLKKAVDETKDRLKELRKAAETVTPDQIGQDKYDALQREIIDTENKLESLEKEYKNFGSVGTQKIAAVGKKMEDLGGKMKAVGGALTKYVTVPIMALGAGSFAAWQEIDSALDTVTKKTGATGDALEEMHGIVRDVATSMPVAFEDVGVAVGEVNTRFGVTGTQLDELTRQFLKFADLNETDVNSSIDSVQSAMAAFGLTADDASLVLDAFNVAGQNTGISVDQLAEKLKQNAVALQEMGFSLTDSAMFMAELDKAGVDTSTVLTGLKAALKNATKEGKPMSEALSEIQSGLKNAKTDTEAAQLATELFGTRAGAAISEYVRNGQLDFESLGTTLEDYAGNVSTTFEETQDPADEFKTVMNEIKELGFEIAEDVMPVVKDVLTQLKDIIEQLKSKWEELSPEQQKMIIDFALLAAAVGPVIMVLGQLVMIVGTVLTYAPMITAALGTVAGAFSWPVVAIAGLVAACIWLGQNWDQVCEWANNLKEKVSAAIEGMKQKVSDSIEGVKAKFQEMKDKVSNIMNMVKTDISNKIQAAKDKVTSVVNAMKSGVTNTMSGMRSAISSTFESIKSGISNKINAAKSAVSNAMSAIRGLLSGSISFPHITLPHFTVTGSPPFGLGGHGSPPHISVSWYAKAMDKPYILDGATIFGAMGGQLLGGGEAGREVVMGEEMFNRMTNMSRVETRLAAIEGLLSQYLPAGQRIIMDSGELVGVVNRGLGGLYG